MPTSFRQDRESAPPRPSPPQRPALGWGRRISSAPTSAIAECAIVWVQAIASSENGSQSPGQAERLARTWLLVEVRPYYPPNAKDRELRDVRNSRILNFVWGRPWWVRRSELISSENWRGIFG